MKSQFIISFKSLGRDFQAEVRVFQLEATKIYDVCYSIKQNLHPASRIQVYSGRGEGPVHYWRQRITSAGDELRKPEFIEAIGYAIDQIELSIP